MLMIDSLLELCSWYFSVCPGKECTDPRNNHSPREFLPQSEQAASITQTADGIDWPSTDMQERYIFHHVVTAYHLVWHVWSLGCSMLRARRRRALVPPAASWLDGHPVRPILLPRRLAGSLLRLYEIYDGIRHRCSACRGASTPAASDISRHMGCTDSLASLSSPQVQSPSLDLWWRAQTRSR